MGLEGRELYGNGFLIQVETVLVIFQAGSINIMQWRSSQSHTLMAIKIASAVHSVPGYGEYPCLYYEWKTNVL